MSEYQKLVRGKIPDIIRANGETPITRILTDDQELIQENIKKIVEEAGELSIAKTLDQRREELSDILTAADNLRSLLGAVEVDAIRAKKDAERGTFAEGVFLERTE